MNKIGDANREVNEGIANFEETLHNLGINTKVKKEDA